MNIQLILCHPHAGSFNHAIAAQVRKSLSDNRHTVNFHDLYREKFDPVISYDEMINDCVDELVNTHINEIIACDGIVIVHPNWWGKPPAMLSGWIDRVLRMNIAYTFPKGGEGGSPVSLLKIQKVLILNTSNTTTERESHVFGDPLESIWKKCVFEFCGAQDIVRKTFSVVVDSSPEDRGQWLNEIYLLTAAHFPNDGNRTSKAY